MKTEKNSNTFNPKLTGSFFVLAAVSSIIGLKLYDPILNNNHFLIEANDNYSQIIFGAINELILVVTATGTGIMLFPLLIRYSQSMGIGYLSFRLLEVVLILIGTLSILTALSISQQYSNAVIHNKENAEYLMLTFIGLHKWVFILGPNFMLAINTFIYSYVFHKTKAIPTKLSVLGLIASILIMTAAILELFGIIDQISTWGIILALPIASYEMTLAAWLIFRGIKSKL